MALFLSWCIRIDAGRTGAKGQDVRLLLRHRQGQGLTSANSYVKCRLKSDAESANMRVAHIFAHGEKSAKRLKTKGIPQTQRFAGFLFIVRRLQFGYFYICHLKISMCCKERPSWSSLLIVHFFRYIRSRILQQISYYLIELYCILWGDDRHI